ncbi:MAG: hypothetical protein ACXV3A_12795 [Kineosporiaceae bacterium]
MEHGKRRHDRQEDHRVDQPIAVATGYTITPRLYRSSRDGEQIGGHVGLVQLGLPM